MAALGNKHRFVALLLGHYADPSLTDAKDQLPLDLAAAANDSDECVRLITVEMGMCLIIVILLSLFIIHTAQDWFIVGSVSCLTIIQ